MILNLAIDADSLVYKACYRHQLDFGAGVDIEKAYLEFCYEVGKIRAAVWKIISYQKGDQVIPAIVLSPKHTFRNELSEDYKANRKGDSIHGIKQLKLMIMHRLPDWGMVAPGIEADDIVIYLASHRNYMVAAIDKDVINACETSCYNYNKGQWEQPRSKWEIERWYAKQCLMGDSTDGISGAKDVGKARAQNWIDKYIGEAMSWTSFIDMFGDESVAIQTMNLIRMDRVVEMNGKFVFKPWDPWDDGNGYWDF